MLGANMNVLLIEDEQRIHDFVRPALEAEGLVVESALDAQTGLRAALDGSFELIVLDLMMPGTSGLKVLQELRDATATTPVLVLTARSELPAKLLSFDLGATDYMTKPFALGEFVARVRVQLRRSATAEGATIHAGALELDLMRRQVHCDGVVTDLSEREFGVLRCLAGRVGQVFTRERLLAEVWGIDFDPGTNVVDVCVRRLRKKLGPDAPIETVRNVGYCVRAA
ncbi:MAG: two-component system, OmpR family, response regulator [Solirubrobacteraceae bacterium]|jgi:DNA-binding response OmpR family regulator|nr:two-component system, OmpR family, response regulator [Solirubrobacteraceae bacterium]